MLVEVQMMRYIMLVEVQVRECLILFMVRFLGCVEWNVGLQRRWYLHVTQRECLQAVVVGWLLLR